MTGFRAERGMLLRNGMRECVFVRDAASAVADESERPPVPSSPPPRYF
jgi:hypothetical protein